MIYPNSNIGQGCAFYPAGLFIQPGNNLPFWQMMQK